MSSTPHLEYSDPAGDSNRFVRPISTVFKARESAPLGLSQLSTPGQWSAHPRLSGERHLTA